MKETFQSRTLSIKEEAYDGFNSKFLLLPTEKREKKN